MSAARRQCDGCTLCCKYLAVDSPDGAQPWKKAWRTCEHCVGKECAIYPARPASCRTFQCLWLKSDLMPEKFRPDRVKAVLTEDREHGTVMIHCMDKDRLRIVGGRSEFSRFVLSLARREPVILATEKEDMPIGNSTSRRTPGPGT